jgi:allantoin racemase
MQILIVNPNTTASMTEKIAVAARAVARADAEIIATNPREGPASIQGFHDVAMCVPGLLAEIARYPSADAIVIACFDDTGLDAARCQADVPVIGIGEAAYHAASFLSCKFSVITTLGRSVPGIEANLKRYGLDARCAKVRATEIPVLELERNDPGTLGRIRSEIARALEEDRAEAIVLGCAGMADLMSRLSDEFKVPVIDGVACATTFAEALAATGLKTSKIGGYAPPTR